MADQIISRLPLDVVPVKPTDLLIIDVDQGNGTLTTEKVQATSVVSIFYGVTAPSVAQYNTWIDQSTTPATQRVWDGSQWIAVATIDSNAHVYAIESSAIPALVVIDANISSIEGSITTLSAEVAALQGAHPIVANTDSQSSTAAAAAASALLSGQLGGLAIDANTSNIEQALCASNASGIIYSGDIAHYVPLGFFGMEKICVQSDGSLRYSLHNKFLNSEDFSQASWHPAGLTVGAQTSAGLWPLTATGTSLVSVYNEPTDYSGTQDDYQQLTFIAAPGTTNWAWVALTDSSLPSYINLATGAAGSVQSGTTVVSYDTDENGNPLPVGQRRWVVSARLAAYVVGSIGICDANGSQNVTAGATINVLRAAQCRGVLTIPYVKTGSTMIFGPGYDWTYGEQAMLLEFQNTKYNSLWSDDLTQSVWTKTGCTAALNATGPDGQPCSTLTATAANATCLQSISDATAAQTFQVWIKRITGTGAISITADGGTTWTAVTPGVANFAMAYVHGGANPSIGVQMATSGDVIEVALAVNTTDAFWSSPRHICSVTGLTRARDTGSLSLTGLLSSDTTVYFDLYAPSDPNGGINVSLSATGTYALAESSGSEIIGVFYAPISSITGEAEDICLAGDYTPGERYEITMRSVAYGSSLSVNGLGASTGGWANVGEMTSLTLSNGAPQWVRRCVLLPQTIDYDVGQRLFYSGTETDPRYVDDRLVCIHGAGGNTRTAREPSVVLLWDRGDSAGGQVSFMQTGLNSTGEQPARIQMAPWSFDKVKQQLTIGSAFTFYQSSDWAAGTADSGAQSPVIMKQTQGANVGRTHCLYSQIENSAGWVRIYSSYSDANGAAGLWTAPAMIYDPGGTPHYAILTPTGDYVNFPASSAYPGRLLTAAYTDTGMIVPLWIDPGGSWTVGAPFSSGGGNEMTFAYRPNDTVVMTLRTETANERLQCESSNGGAAFTAPTAIAGFTGTNVAMSTATADVNGDFGPLGKIWLSGPINTSPIRSEHVIQQLVGDPVATGGSTYIPLGTSRPTGYSSVKSFGGGYLAVGYESPQSSGAANNVCAVRLMILRMPANS